MPAVRTWMAVNLHKNSHFKRVELALHADVPAVVISQLTSVLTSWEKANDVWKSRVPCNVAWRERFGGSCPFPFQLRSTYILDDGTYRGSNL